MAEPLTLTCYRHADRLTQIRCQRCDRGICPECMREAAVGFQCPDCVALGQRTVRQPRTIAGGLIPRQVGVVSFVLIGINALAFVAQLLTGGDFGTATQLGAMLSVSAYDPDTGALLTGVADGAWWRVITSAFLHFGFFHLLMNMYALYVFGPMLEKALGQARFIALYLSTSVTASAFVYALSEVNALTAGASGAVFGLFGCALVLMLKQRQNVVYLLVLLGINVVISLQGNISWQGHLGGLVSGAALGAVFAFVPRTKNRTTIHIAAFVALGILVAIAMFFRTGQLLG